MGAKHRGLHEHGEAQTSGASTATVVSFDLASNGRANFNNCSVMVKATFVGRDMDAGVGVSGELAGIFSRVAGTLSQNGATATLTAIFGDASLTTAAISLDTSGTAVRARVTGVALKNIEWFVDMIVTVN